MPFLAEIPPPTSTLLVVDVSDKLHRRSDTYLSTTMLMIRLALLICNNVIPPIKTVLVRGDYAGSCIPALVLVARSVLLRWALSTPRLLRSLTGHIHPRQLRVYDVTVQFLSCRLPPPRLRRIAQPYIAMTIALIHDFGIHATRDRDPETGALLDVHKVPAWGVHRPRIERLHDCVGRVERDVPTRRRALCQEGP